MYRLYLALTIAFAICGSVRAETDATLDTPIARAPDFTLRSLLPDALDVRIEDGFSKKLGEGYPLQNDQTGIFQVQFELIDGALPDATIYSLLISQDDQLVKLVEQIEKLGTNPAFRNMDTEFPDGLTCFGMVEQALITCRVADGAFQLSAVDGLGEAADYDLAKAAVLDLDLEAYVAALTTR